MPKIEYGSKTIEYSILEEEGLKSHYITVERDKGVMLKGKAVSEEQSQQLVLKKAKWILEKLKLVEAVDDGEIVTGSRIQYLGRKYYVQLIKSPDNLKVQVEFNESKFKISAPSKYTQSHIHEALHLFFKEKAIEKITPRIMKWSNETGLIYNQLRFMKMDKRWGSCTPTNNIHINIDSVRLPYSLIDYLVVHELVHTKIKSHSKDFWAELARHIPNWKDLDEKMGDMKF
jgi:predicted metal-dependent hydrolase